MYELLGERTAADGEIPSEKKEKPATEELNPFQSVLLRKMHKVCMLYMFDYFMEAFPMFIYYDVSKHRYMFDYVDVRDDPRLVTLAGSRRRGV
ncbi:hypothetical protein V6N12_006314 [Hibiscus sabdariffa]|uniref:Uncharacterized protein n=1 Tax=Hibiscus sabdariffa TaxID=183260 RepID=A0ABR2EYG1_9ROSI